jgi:hypothetical protein
MFDIPYSWRVGWLLFFMLVVAHYDWRVHGAKAKRWREYLFILSAGVIGILFIAAVDAVGATISHDYYIYMRDIPDDAPFRYSVLIKSIKSGLPAGLVVGCVYMAANNPRPTLDGLPYRRLYVLSLLPMVCAVLVSPFAAMAGVVLDPLHIGPFLVKVNELGKDPDKIQHLLSIWGASIGLYAGGIAGTIWGAVKIRAERRTAKINAPDAPPVQVVSPAATAKT